MVLRIYTGASIALFLLSSPVSLARLDTQAQGDASQASRVMTASVAQRNETHHLLELVSTIARPAPVLTIGAPVLREDGMQLGYIEDILVHRDIIQAVVSMRQSVGLESVVMSDAQGPLLLLVPATAFETQSGNAVLSIPLEQLGHMERIN